MCLKCDSVPFRPFPAASSYRLFSSTHVKSVLFPRLDPPSSTSRNHVFPGLQSSAILHIHRWSTVSSQERSTRSSLRMRNGFVLQPPPSPPSISEVANDIGVATSVKSAFSVSTVITEVNEGMSLFKSIIFSLPVDDDDSTILCLAPASLANEVREIFASASSTSEQLIADAFFSLATDILLDPHYLNRLGRFPLLSHTLVIFMLQSHYHIGNMDCNMENLKKCCFQLSRFLLSLPTTTSSCYCRTRLQM